MKNEGKAWQDNFLQITALVLPLFTGMRYQSIATESVAPTRFLIDCFCRLALTCCWRWLNEEKFREAAERLNMLF